MAAKLQTPTPVDEVAALEIGSRSIDPLSEDEDLGYARRGALVATPGQSVNSEPCGMMHSASGAVEQANALAKTQSPRCC
jgi:hypothetical protein